LIEKILHRQLGPLFIPFSAPWAGEG